MKKAFLTAVLIVSVSAFGQRGREFTAVQLLEGYSAVPESTVDTDSWTIRGKNGFRIHFEAGPNEGCAVSSTELSTYSWHRKQTINHQEVRLALVRPGVRYDPDLDAERNLPPGNVLLVCFPLSKSHADFDANFVAKIKTKEELADMLLMVATFDAAKAF